MKINECSVIDNKVIDEMITEYEMQMDNIFCIEEAELYYKLSVLKHIKQHSKPLEPIVRDAYFKEDCLNELTPADFNDYLNQTEI